MKPETDSQLFQKIIGAIGGTGIRAESHVYAAIQKFDHRTAVIYISIGHRTTYNMSSCICENINFLIRNACHMSQRKVRAQNIKVVKCIENVPLVCVPMNGNVKFVSNGFHRSVLLDQLFPAQSCPMPDTRWCRVTER